MLLCFHQVNRIETTTGKRKKSVVAAARELCFPFHLTHFYILCSFFFSQGIDRSPLSYVVWRRRNNGPKVPVRLVFLPQIFDAFISHGCIWIKANADGTWVATAPTYGPPSAAARGSPEKALTRFAFPIVVCAVCFSQLDFNPFGIFSWFFSELERRL